MVLKLCNKQYYKIDLKHKIAAPQLSGGWQHDYSAKTRQAFHANEQSIHYLSLVVPIKSLLATRKSAFAFSHTSCLLSLFYFRPFYTTIANSISSKVLKTFCLFEITFLYVHSRAFYINLFTIVIYSVV